MTMLKSALVAAAAFGAIAATASAASADVACNRWGECWHVRDHYTNYPAHLGVVFHAEGWRGDHHRHWRWRRDRRDDHGYYFHGRWHRF